MEEIIVLISKTYGLAGLIMLSPFFGLVVVFKQNIKSQAAVHAANMQTIAAHQLRVQDAQALNTKLLEVIKEQSALNGETNIALERISDALNEIQTKVVKGR